MSVLRYPEGMNPSDVQIWNNAAFDNEEYEDLSLSLRPSWSPLEPFMVNPSGSTESFSSKENQIPLVGNSSVSVNSPRPVKPLCPKNAVEIPKSNLINVDFKKSFTKKPVLKSLSTEGEIHDEKNIDKEIEEIEMEISRLNSKLESLKLEKAERNAKAVEKKGRVVQAKFMEPKLILKNAEEKKKIETPLSTAGKPKFQRRGLSLGPSEIAAGARRGLSMGPSEIFASTKSRQLGKQEMVTPVQSRQSRRKSCFWKLEEIDEEIGRREKGRKSLSPSPRSRKFAGKAQSSRQAVTTVASKRIVKKDDSVINSVQPKKLFRDGEKSVPANKKPLRPGRVVASRYNQGTNPSSAMRKRSLPENDADESKRCEKKRSLSVGKSRVNQSETRNSATENSSSRVKKRWEIPTEIVVKTDEGSETQKSPPSISVIPDLLPRIRIARSTIETPRDSGPAKRVAELIGKKTFFSNEAEEEEEEEEEEEGQEKVEASVCQALSFADEDIQE